MISIETTGNLRKIRIGRSLTQDVTSHLGNQIVSHLSDCNEIIVDVSRVENIDKSGFELLLSTMFWAASLNKQLSFSEYSPAIVSELARHNGNPFFN